MDGVMHGRVAGWEDRWMYDRWLAGGMEGSMLYKMDGHALVESVAAGVMARTWPSDPGEASGRAAEWPPCCTALPMNPLPALRYKHTVTHAVIGQTHTHTHTYANAHTCRKTHS